MKQERKVQMRKSKMQYIGALKEVLNARDDFDDIKYFMCGDKEYIFLSDIIGAVAVLDVTGYTNADILKCIALVELGKAPKNYVADKAKRLEIAKKIRGYK